MICVEQKSAAPGSMICWRASKRCDVGRSWTKPPRRCCAKPTSNILVKEDLRVESCDESL